ncbi:MAG: VCBS repeat-containing protein, partial [Bacteroidetes bacterium]|nr:VCBS repeat-containing protein [Bacteroidota bacterium]
MIKKVIITVLLANNVLAQSGMPDLLVPDIGSQGAPECTQECYVGPTQPNSTYITGGSFKGILAGKCVHLLNGFHAGNFTAGGNFHATISNTLLDLKVITPYSAIGASVGKYEKYELGIKLPATIQAQIDNYLAGGSGINPYDPDQIDISFNAFRTTPFRHSISGYAFFYKEFIHNSTNTSWDNVINDPNKDYTWRLRIAPDEVGEWSGSISVNVNHTTVSIGCFNFNCVPSNNQGYLKVGNYDRLKFSETGNQFFGIGQNIGFVNSFSCAYYSAQPQHYITWQGYVSDLASNGGNFFRFFAHTSSFLPELNKLGDYDEVQPHMWELDKMFDLAHDKNMHFIFCLDNFQTYDINDPFCFTNGWQNNPYHTTIPGVNQPIDFFQNPIAKKYYQNRLRYMLSRWGYSSNIALFQIMNEIDQTGREYAVGNSEVPIRNDYKNSSNYRQATASWHWEMAEYIKSIDQKKHLVSTSYSGEPENDDNTYFSPNINVTSIHSYGLNRRINLDRNNALFPIIRKYKKPSTIGEMGNGNFLVDNCFDLEFHNSIWASAFMGGYSVGLNWNAWEKNEYRANNISHLRWFFDNNVDLSKARDVLFGSEDELHKITYIDYSFIKAQSLERTYEYYYLTDLKGYFAGWVHNMSCHWWNYRYIDPCINSLVAAGQATNPDVGTKADQNLVSPYTIAERNIKITSGLSFSKKYELKWFYTRIIQHSLTTLTIAPNLFGKAKLPVPTTDENYPDWAFVLKSKDCFFCKQSNLGHVVLDPDTLDCPNDTIIATGTYEDDSTGIFNYNWNFGNGQFSNVAHPKIYYSIPGSYDIRLIVTDTLGQIDTLDQRFIVQDCRPTVGGFLKRDTICGSGPAVGDTIIFIDSSGSIVNSISYVVTDSSGFFSFNKAEVHSLDTAIRYRIATKSGLAIADTASHTIREWITLSPVMLHLEPDFPQQYFTKVTTGDIVNLGRTTSSSWGDYDGDGDLDVIAFCNPANTLYRNDCDGNFTQVTGNVLSTPTTPFNSTPAEWIDYDNDGDIDIILYKLAGGTGVPQSAQLYQNDGSGNFTLITTGQMVNDTLSPRSA